MTREITALGDGHVRVELPANEYDMLHSLPEQLRPILSGEHDVAGARDRLFPPAYDDPQHEADYRELIGSDLADERLAALEAFADTLEQGSHGRRRWSADLTPEQAEAWLSATNDARLVLASVVGITSEEQWDEGPAEGDPAGAALWYLGWLQDALIGALSERRTA